MDSLCSSCAVSPAGGAVCIPAARTSTKEEEPCFSSTSPSNMAPNRRLKRVVASQPGFLKLKSSQGVAGSAVHRKKRLNKNKKKSWNKYSDINDVDEFLQDIRHQERTTG